MLQDSGLVWDAARQLVAKGLSKKQATVSRLGFREASLKPKQMQHRALMDSLRCQPFLSSS